MAVAFANPFFNSFDQLDPKLLKIFLSQKKGRTRGMGDFWSDLGSTLTDGVAGLTEALGFALEEIVHTIGQIGETIALVVRACLGQVSWQDVLGSLGKVFQDIGTAMVFLDPTRQAYNWLSTAPLTAHAFHELDKFTGGYITNIANLSDLPGRVLRGDAISTLELIKDALFVITVVMMIVTFPEGLAVMLAMMLGRQVCSHQTEAQGACMAAFQIAGLVVGDWAGTGDDFLTALENSDMTFLSSTGLNIATREVVHLCQAGKWAGGVECQEMGTVLADYIKSGGRQDWSTFLANELVRIGRDDVVLALYPPNSREAIAIKKQRASWNLVNLPGPTGAQVVSAKTNPLTYVMLAAGALALVAGSAS